jgi:hypothetical protein
MIVAALLPLSLREALAHLPALTQRLEPPLAEARQLQLPLFRAAMRTKAKVRPRQDC